MTCEQLACNSASCGGGGERRRAHARLDEVTLAERLKRQRPEELLGLAERVGAAEAADHAGDGGGLARLPVLRELAELLEGAAAQLGPA